MKTVLITGASRGIGAACVEIFASAGDQVYFFYRSDDASAQALSARTGAVAVKCDVSDPAAVQKAFASLPECDVLVNNSGFAEFSLFQDISEEGWDRMIQTHLGGTFRCSKAVLPCMISKKSGCIVNVASMWGQVGASCEVHYSAAKAGVIGLTKALAKEVAPSGIRVNCVAPGVIDTDMNRMLSPRALEDLTQEIPLGRLGTATEVADVIYWLTTDQSAYLTGQIIAPNGGLIV
ncbi:MAG: 3-oxoacyl-ACP reductase FabG [Clostridia bacterium]|nr:3-oxoacyl-ACP reductase FabG [Clostridia bacterium]